jgi:hypothetical protein
LLAHLEITRSVINENQAVAVVKKVQMAVPNHLPRHEMIQKFIFLQLLFFIHIEFF